MNTLPNEVLEQVLALVPAGQHGSSLTKLRRVCRRWAELIKTSAAIWRHRTLCVKLRSPFTFYWGGGVVLGAGALRCAPVLGCLDLEVEAGLSYKRTKLITSKVEHCQTKVSLICTISVLSCLPSTPRPSSGGYVVPSGEHGEAWSSTLKQRHTLSHRSSTLL